MSGKKSLAAARVLVVGAGGGLGQALAQELQRRGAVVYWGLRDPSKAPLEAQNRALRLDLCDPQSIAAAATTLTAEGGVAFVACAAGVDVRSAFTSHSLEDIDRTLATNLRGPMLLTQAFLPQMLKQGSGGLIFFGGFADGRLAFPYYSADSASRAGLRSYIESINREIEGQGPQLCYFGPAVADTEAERPFHAIWKQLGVQPVSAEQVAREAADCLEQGKTLHVMGGFLTRFFARLNGSRPALADALLMRQYNKALKRAFGV